MYQPVTGLSHKRRGKKIDGTRLEARQLAGHAGRSRCPTMPTARRWPRSSSGWPSYPAAGVRGRGAGAQGEAGRGLPGPGLRPPGRRLRRGVRRLRRRQDPRHAARAAADGGGAHLRRRHAGGEDGPDGRPVRQAALGRHGGDRRRRACPAYRGDIVNAHRVRAGRARARSAAPAPGLLPVGRHAQPAARLHPGRLCLADPRPPVERWASSTAARRASDTATWPTGSPRRWPSCAPAVSPTSARPRSPAPRSTPATRPCCWATSRR